MKFFVWLVLGLLLPLNALAQAYPSKPIRVVVPFPPGGGVDFVARLFQARMGSLLGQSVIIDNQGGATGAIGAATVIHAPPDGYTILFAVGSEMVLRKFLEKNPAYDIARDFTPIAPAVIPVSCIAVGPAVPFNTIQELIDFARRNPGKLNYGTSGVGSSLHLAGEVLKRFGIDMVHVPFKGVAPAMTALRGGQIEVVITNLTTAVPAARDGKVRILAMTQEVPLEDMPGIPTLQQAIPGYDFPPGWYGYFGPAGMPRAIVDRLNDAIVRTTESPEVRIKLKEGLMLPLKGTPEQFAALVASGIEGYGKVVKAAGIQPH